MLDMSQRKTIGMSSPNKYAKLQSDKEEFLPAQFIQPPVKIPYKAIALAIVLFIGGSLLIIIGALLLSGYIDTKYSDRTWPVLILGCLMFIPGAYHVRLAYCAYRGYRGYSFEDIPNFDE